MPRLGRMLTLWSIVVSVCGPLLAGYEGDVIIGGRVVLRIRVPAGGMTVKERADAVMQRINNYLGAEPFTPDDVKVAVRNKEYVVLIGDHLIITADRETAKINKTTPEKLAEIWAENLRKVIPEARAVKGQAKGIHILPPEAWANDMLERAPRVAPNAVQLTQSTFVPLEELVRAWRQYMIQAASCLVIKR